MTISFSAFVDEMVKISFAVSQYSGPLSYGRFKQESYIPPFSAPPLKVAGPVSEKRAATVVAALIEGAGHKQASSPLTPAGRLASSSSIGQPKMGPPPGPSIAQLTKPKGYGTPMAGATKALQSVPGE